MTTKASSSPTAFLTEGPIGSKLAQMAIPMAIGILATMSFNIVDTLFVSGLGDDALAALSFTFPVVMLVVSLSIGLGAGTSSVVAYAAGKHDSAGVKALTTDSMSLTAIASAVLSVIGLFTIEPVFMALGAEAHLIPLIADYMVIWYISVIFLAVPMVSMAAIRALGNTKVQGYIMIFMAVANAILDPLLIYGWGPFPRLEIEGAALATLIVRVASLLFMAYWFRYKENLLSNPFNIPRFIDSTKKILHVGIPAMATNMIIPVSGSIIVAMVAVHGSDAVAGFGVATRIEAMALIFYYALSAVIGPFCGQNLGANNFDRLHNGQKLVLRFCFISGLIITLVLLFLGGWLAGFFSDDDEIIKVTRDYLLIVPASYFAYGVVMSVNASFNGLRKPLPGVAISSARVIVVLFPLAWLFNYLFGLIGLFIAISAANLIVGLAAYLWIHFSINSLSKSNEQNDVVTAK